MTKDETSHLINSLLLFCKGEMNEGSCNGNTDCNSCPIWRACQKITISFINKQSKEEKQ